MRKDILFVTHCSGDKNGAGEPLTLYTSERIQRFGEMCVSAGVSWAIVSAKHGLFLPTEQHNPYDTKLKFSHGQVSVYEKVNERECLLPSSEAHINWLVRGLRSRLEKLGVRRVVYYVGGAPQRICGYLLVVHRALDRCQRSHYRPDDVVACIRRTSAIYIANGLAELEAKLKQVE